MAKVCVLLADGFEEVEALTVVDILRRSRIYVETVSIEEDVQVAGSHHIPILADAVIDEIDPKEYDMAVLPGGMPGTVNLEKDPRVKALLDQMLADGKPVGAICAAPMILAHFGMLDGYEATIYPGMEGELDKALFLPQKVVEDGPFITSRGVGTAIPFAFRIVERLASREVVKEVCDSIVYPYGNLI